MFGSLQRPSVLIAAGLVAAATVMAVRDDKVTSLVIAAAMVASLLAGVSILMDMRLGDAHDSGKLSERRAIARDLVELVDKAD